MDMNIVFDLDGTLADISHRLHYIKQPSPNWDAFHHACVFDKPIMELISTLQVFWTAKSWANINIEIWSGRSDMVRSHTEAWLKEHGIPHDALLMRSKGDFTPDDQLKESWLNTTFTARPDLVFDDRDSVVKMWRKNGIRCAQVAPGDF